MMGNLRWMCYLWFGSRIGVVRIVEIADKLVEVRLVGRNSMGGVPFFEFNMLNKTRYKHKKLFIHPDMNVQIVLIYS